MYVYRSEGVCAPNVVFFSCVRCGGGSGAEPASVRPCVRASVRPAWPPPFLDPKKRQKQFKINGLGTFDGTPLAPLLARMCFYDPPLMA